MKRIPQENGKLIGMLRHVHGDGHVCTYGGQRLTLSVSSWKLKLTAWLDWPASPWDLPASPARQHWSSKCLQPA